jgi:hypothetical protein
MTCTTQCTTGGHNVSLDFPIIKAGLAEPVLDPLTGLLASLFELNAVQIGPRYTAIEKRLFGP